MMKKFTSIIILAFVCMSYSNTRHSLNNPNCPLSYTAAPNASTGLVRTCAVSGCHIDSPLNSGGGNVTVSGLPAAYIAGTAYPFSITVAHATPNRLIWGFSIKAVNTTNNWLVGTFSTTNANASVKGAAGTTVTTQTRELSHTNAPTTVAQMSYTFTNLTWTAPAIPGVNDNNIKFYIVGNAGDGSGDVTGDFIYSTTFASQKGPLPVTLAYFTATANNKNGVTINWQTEQEINSSHFDVETSNDAINWKKISSVSAKGNSVGQSNYSYADNHPSVFNSNIYYRLKTVDIDGTFRYSDIKSVNIKNDEIVIDNITNTILQKNTNDVYRIISPKAKAINITIIDATAKILYSSVKSLNIGETMIELPTQKYCNNGVKYYFVQFASNGFKKSFTKLAL